MATSQSFYIPGKLDPEILKMHPFNFVQALFFYTFATQMTTVVVAQLVRASDCDSEGRRFEPGHPPQKKPSALTAEGFFFFKINRSSHFSAELFV